MAHSHPLAAQNVDTRSAPGAGRVLVDAVHVHAPAAAAEGVEQRHERPVALLAVHEQERVAHVALEHVREGGVEAEGGARRAHLDGRAVARGLDGRAEDGVDEGGHGRGEAVGALESDALPRAAEGHLGRVHDLQRGRVVGVEVVDELVGVGGEQEADAVRREAERAEEAHVEGAHVLRLVHEDEVGRGHVARRELAALGAGDGRLELGVVPRGREAAAAEGVEGEAGHARLEAARLERLLRGVGELGVVRDDEGAVRAGARLHEEARLARAGDGLDHHARARVGLEAREHRPVRHRPCGARVAGASLV